ncbi:hypothetical protein RKE29_05105 [Streptomyces sp. B1866]|uniref:Hsp70 family protein n=1 Tax=Streptomyces sp. B1866 TaxID=3075431 RepID=UPI002890AC0A|nr:hypothetical protein [Streptomyces sp. B1866]MDT3396025.1 hypothetical protein [Streptomyces sp. B1866]
MGSRGDDMADGTTITILGFDLGHGDTAVAKVHAGSRPQSASLGDRNAPPEIVPLGGDRKQHVTAVAVRREDGAVLVGEAAVEARGAELFTAFKSPDLDQEQVRRPLELFARSVVAHVRDERVWRDATVRWVFGHPSGWTTEQVAAYRELLAGVCTPDGVLLVPESRAALLYARDSGDVPDSGAFTRGALTAATLIVDIGSSTTDYTYVAGGVERPVDHGNVALGAHLLDKTLLELAIDRSPDAGRLRAALAADPTGSAARQLEMACRKLKERFFNTSPEHFAANPHSRVRTTEEVFTPDGDVVELPIRISPADMEHVLDTPQPALGGLSWRAAYRRDLAGALERVGGEASLVLLTGGPSRMRFVLDTSRELADRARVVLGTEPESAIARGLALAGRTEERTRGFRDDVRRFVDSGTVADLVAERLPRLAEGMGQAVASGLTDHHVIPAFRAWRERHVVTVDDMCARIVSGVNAELTGEGSAALKPIVADWTSELRTELAQHTAVICRRWNLEPTALALPDVTMSAGGMSVAVNTTAATEVLDNLSTLVTVAVSGVVAASLFGSGAALIMATGPFAVLIAGVAVFVGLGTMKEKIMEEIGDKDIPLPLRRLRGEQAMVRKLREQAAAQEGVLAAELAAQFQSDGSGRLGREITAAIEEQLLSVAADAELLIA